MTNAQLELSFEDCRAHLAPSASRSPSFRRAQWWFRRMRQIVDCALDWPPAPAPRPEQILFASRDFQPWTA
jgi:hypothetical protein